MMMVGISVGMTEVVVTSSLACGEVEAERCRDMMWHNGMIMRLED